MVPGGTQFYCSHHRKRNLSEIEQGKVGELPPKKSVKIWVASIRGGGEGSLMQFCCTFCTPNLLKVLIDNRVGLRKFKSVDVLFVSF